MGSTRTGISALATVMVAATIAASQPAVAHHSFAMFDRQKKVTLEGTVKEFQWTNPHIWVQVIVMEDGKPVEYSIEGSSPNNLVRNGWSRNSLKPGDAVTVIINPLRNGDKGGSLSKITLADGSVLP